MTFSAFAGVAVARNEHGAMALAVLTCAGLLFVLAHQIPTVAITVLLVSLISIPYYTLPNAGGQPLIAAAAVSWLAAIVFVIRRVHRGRLRLGLIDGLVLGLVFVMLFVTGIGVRSAGDAVRTLPLWAGPYIAIRIFATERDGINAFARRFVQVAILLLPFVLLERATGWNPFRSWLAYNTYYSEVWAPTLKRFDTVRAEASFGHPIALSMFLASAAVVAIGLAMTALTTRSQRLWAAGAAALIIGHALTLSRTGWVVLVVAVLVMVPLRSGLLRRPISLVGLAAAFVVLALVPQAAPVRDVVMGTFGENRSTELAQAGNYRHELLQHAQESGVLRTWGNRDPQFIGSVDNEYILLADRWGVVAMALLFAIPCALGVLLALRRTSDVGAWIVAACIGNFIALAFVAFITQQQVAIWLLAGAAGAVTSHGLRRRDGYEEPGR